MHYKISSKITIKTENAAKPQGQSSQFLTKLLADLPGVASSFDYGCGKLRYFDAILERTDELTLIDSEVQLSRTQLLRKKRTSIRAELSGRNELRICNDVEFARIRSKYERGFCINVLSIIPIIKRRKEVLSTIRARLHPGGKCLFVVQYRNSDFTRMGKMPNAVAFRDGILVNSLRGYSFFGLIKPDSLVKMVRGAGFDILDLDLNEGSAYLWASPKRHQSGRCQFK